MFQDSQLFGIALRKAQSLEGEFVVANPYDSVKHCKMVVVGSGYTR